MRKEILTDEKIKLDIPFSRAQDWGDMTDKFLRFFLPFTALGIILILATTWKLALPCFAVSAGVLIWYILILKRTPKKTEPVYASYTVIKDKLVNIVEETEQQYSTSGHYYKDITYFYFSSQRWRVRSDNYRWSELYYMSKAGLCNTSLIGDEFYLVMLNDTHEIACVYNTKLFDYKTELS